MPSRTAFVLAAAIAAVPATTFADSSGSAGSVISVTVLESSSDDYGSYRGKIVIREGTEPSATQTEYRWGGTICANRNLSESNIALLVEALRGACLDSAREGITAFKEKRTPDFSKTK